MAVKIKFFLIAILVLLLFIVVVDIYDQIALSGNEVWHVPRCLQVLVTRVRVLF